MFKKFPQRPLCSSCSAWLLALNGCATIFPDGEDVVTFNSNVDQTNVFLDGSKMGVTPLTGSKD